MVSLQKTPEKKLEVDSNAEPMPQVWPSVVQDLFAPCSFPHGVTRIVCQFSDWQELKEDFYLPKYEQSEEYKPSKNLDLVKLSKAQVLIENIRQAEQKQREAYRGILPQTTVDRENKEAALSLSFEDYCKSPKAIDLLSLRYHNAHQEVIQATQEQLSQLCLESVKDNCIQTLHFVLTQQAKSASYLGTDYPKHILEYACSLGKENLVCFLLTYHFKKNALKDQKWEEPINPVKWEMTIHGLMQFSFSTISRLENFGMPISACTAYTMKKDLLMKGIKKLLQEEKQEQKICHGIEKYLYFLKYKKSDFDECPQGAFKGLLSLCHDKPRVLLRLLRTRIHEDHISPFVYYPDQLKAFTLPCQVIILQFLSLKMDMGKSCFKRLNLNNFADQSVNLLLGKGKNHTFYWQDLRENFTEGDTIADITDLFSKFIAQLSEQERKIYNLLLNKILEYTNRIEKDSKNEPLAIKLLLEFFVELYEQETQNFDQIKRLAPIIFFAGAQVLSLYIQTPLVREELEYSATAENLETKKETKADNASNSTPNARSSIAVNNP